MKHKRISHLTLAVAIVLLAGALGWFLGAHDQVALAAPVEPGVPAGSGDACTTFPPMVVECIHVMEQELCTEDPGSRIVSLPLWSPGEGGPHPCHFTTVSVNSSIAPCGEAWPDGYFPIAGPAPSGFYVYEEGIQYGPYYGVAACLPFYPDSIEPFVTLPCDGLWTVSTQVTICCTDNCPP